MELFISCVANILRVLLFELARLSFVGINSSDKGYCCVLCLRGGGGGVKSDQPLVNVGSTKPHDSKKFNRSILPKVSNIPPSAMKYATQNECNSFDIGTRVAPFGLNNLEFNGKVGVIESPLESSGQKDVPLHSPPPATVRTL